MEKKRKRPTFEAYTKRLRCFKQYSAEKYPDYDEFIEVAKKMYIEKYGSLEAEVQDETEKITEEPTSNSVGNWQTAEEAEFAEKLYTGYQTGKNITELSDLELLKTLVMIEVMIGRLQKEKSPSVHQIVELSNQQIILKTKLGLLGEQNQDGVAERIKSLMRKAQVWRNKNRNSFEIRCGHCGKENLLRIKTENYEAFKHPFYRDRVLCNQHLWDLYKEGKITKLDIAKVLFADKSKENIFYIDWLERKIYNIQENDDRATDNQ